MKAVLWDGNKQLNGKLILNEDGILFKLLDFEETNLNLKIAFTEIHDIKHYNVYDLAIGGVEIILKSGKKNVFIVDNTIHLKNKLDSLIFNNKI